MDQVLVLLLFKGYPATGKSYLAKKLGNHLNIPVIVRDKFKTILVKKGFSLKEIGYRSYDIMWKYTMLYLGNNKSCICDTSLIQPHGLSRIEYIKKHTQAKIIIIECYCSDKKIHKKRLISRKKIPYYYGIKTNEQFKIFVKENKKWDNFLFPYCTIRVDTCKKLNIKDFSLFIKDIILLDCGKLYYY